MNIEVLGGKDEIGGNKIVVAHDGTKVLLDFGIYRIINFKRIEIEKL